MAENAFAPKPLVDVNLVSEFGGVEDEAVFREEGVAQHDYTYAPGFSEMRRGRDLALGQLARNEIRAREVPVLPVNLRWFRTVKGSGSDPDQMRVFRAKNLGYRPATKADIGQPWLTQLPPGAQLAPDGTVKSAGGDLALFVIGQEGAAKNALKKKILTEELVDGMQFAEGGLKRVGEKVKGAQPTIEKLGGSQ